MHTIFISVGSNIEREKHIRAGLNGLARAFSTLSISTIYESEAVGFAGTNFYNLVVRAQTSKPIAEVCRILKQIENENGRTRGQQKFAPRTLDLDLLLYDDVITTDGVDLPRGEICTNAFVLLPLAELAPQVVHPVSGHTFAQMWRAYHNPEQKLWPVNFVWSDD